MSTEHIGDKIRKRESTAAAALSILRRQDLLAALWERDRPTLAVTDLESDPTVLTVSNPYFELCPPGNVAILAAAPQARLATPVASAATDEGPSPVMDEIDRRAIAAGATTEEPATADILGVVEVTYGGEPVTSIVVDRLLEFNLVFLPFSGGEIDGSAFGARQHLTDAEGPELQVLVLLHAAELTAVERLAGDKAQQLGFDPDAVEFSFIHCIGHFFKKVIHDVAGVAVDFAKDIEKGIEDVATDVAHAAVDAIKAVGNVGDKVGHAVGDAVNKVAHDAQLMDKIVHEVGKAALNDVFKKVARAAVEAAEAAGDATPEIEAAAEAAAEACAEGVCAAAESELWQDPPAWVREMAPEADVAELIRVRNYLLSANKRLGL